MQELDAIGADNEGILVLAATNAPWDVDEAIKRPGRFDRMLFVPPPDEPARERILELLLRRRPTEDLDLRKLAARRVADVPRLPRGTRLEGLSASMGGPLPPFRYQGV